MIVDNQVRKEIAAHYAVMVCRKALKEVTEKKKIEERRNMLGSAHRAFGAFYKPKFAANTAKESSPPQEK